MKRTLSCAVFVSDVANVDHEVARLFRDRRDPGERNEESPPETNARNTTSSSDRGEKVRNLTEAEETNERMDG